MRIVGCAAFLIAFGLISGCEGLDPLEEGACGNFVKDSGEDCDEYPQDPGTICRAPGTEGECRFDCTPAVLEGEVRGACPPGYVCSESDYICRAPKGAFGSGASLIDEGIQKIYLGDFDGDGRKDALTVTAAGQRVHYFDTRGALVTSTDVPGALQRPGVGRLTGEGDLTDDFTNVAGIGVSVLRGQENRSIAPTQFELLRITEPSRYSLFAIEVDSNEPGDEVMGLFQKTNEEAVTIRRVIIDGSVTKPVLTITDIPGVLTGEAAVADLFNDSTTACGEAVFGFAGADYVTVFSPCASMGSLKDQKISLDKPGIITSAPHIADMNDDGLLDIVVGGFAKHVTANLTEETCHFVGVSYNLGQGNFASDPAGIIDGKARVVFDYFDAKGESCGINEADAIKQAFVRPIAAGDANGDGVGDYVDPVGIHVSVPIPGTKTIGKFEAPIQLIGTLWTTAVIADITADTIPDVIAGSEIVPGMDFFQGTGNPNVPFNYAKIPSEHPVASLKTGYFDADLVRDVVLAERRLLDPTLPPNSSGDGLAVLFGRPFAPPETPTRFGRMSRIQQVLVASFPLLTIPGNDTMSDIAVLAGREFPEPIDVPTGMGPEVPSAEPKSLLVLPGNGERQLLSSFRLLAPSRGFPVQTAVGRFHGSAAGPDDVAVFGADPLTGDRQLWLLPVLETGQFAPPLNGAVGDAPVTTVSPVSLANVVPPGVVLDDRRLDFVVADIDGKGTDEIVTFLPTNDPVSPDLYRIVVKTGPVTSNGATFPGWLLDPAEHLPDLFLPLQMESADINNDTFEDIAGVFLEKPEKKASLPAAQIAVYLSNGAGGFDKLPISIPRHLDPRPEYSFDDRPWAVAILNADTDAYKEVAIFSTDWMYIADFDPVAKAFLEPVEIAQVGGTAAAAGDVTGDGIDDIVVSDGTNLRVLVALSP